MIDMYFFPSPNTWKVSIMLEECALPYNVHMIDITRDEQFDPAFLAISPNNRVPAIVDRDGSEGALPLFESGAILVYLAEKTGRFLAPAGVERAEALQWLFWQMGGLGPMAGQAHHFRGRKLDDSPYATERYTTETARLYGVLDRQLHDHQWIAGSYGVADIACWGWVWFHRMHGQDLEQFSDVKRWFLAMSERPAVQRGRAVGLDKVPDVLRTMLGKRYFEAPDA